ncbi:MAG: two-component system, chemotaxis family, protein-glutamate methylesterase/glutaminase [Actinomycetota bacterium]|jgi:two-component system chemotaxis response regulator CheB
MPTRDVVVIAASAGGLDALQKTLGGLPATYPGVVFVVSHIPPSASSALASILDRATVLPVAVPTDGEAMVGGSVYVCRPDHHLLLGDGVVLVRRGPKENGHRPAADPLFRSAARYYGRRAVGVILSGTLSDGTAGLQAIRQQGGTAVVQDPEDAAYDGMPRSALEEVGADFVVPADEIGALLHHLAHQSLDEVPAAVDDTVAREVALNESDDRVIADDDHPGHPSSWPCPDCNGVLWEVNDGPVLRFRCRVGHAWIAANLFDEQAVAVEGALWVALRALEDRAALCHRTAERAARNHNRYTAARLEDEGRELDGSVEILRRMVQPDAEALDQALHD